MAVFTVAAVDVQGRVVPQAQNKIDFAIESTGKIIGVGNGDPTCHEPDTFVPSRRAIEVGEWSWKRETLPNYHGRVDTPARTKV